MMRFRAISLIGVLATVSGVPVACLAQQATQQAAAAEEKNVDQKPVATLHMQAREVLLPVTVRDKHGALVTDLNKSDFTLTEDGRPQTIKSFSRESNLPFRVGLLVDTSRSVSAALESERAAAGKFVDVMLPAASSEPGIKEKPAAAGEPSAGDKSATKGKGDEAFLIHFDREVELLQDFTSSREKLHRELEEMGSTQRREDPNGPETTGDERDHSSHGRNGTQLYDAIFLASDDLMKQKDGRKALIVFSDGVDHGSKETLNDAVDARIARTWLSTRSTSRVRKIEARALGFRVVDITAGAIRAVVAGIRVEGGIPAVGEAIRVAAGAAEATSMRLWTARRSCCRLRRGPAATPTRQRRKKT